MTPRSQPAFRARLLVVLIGLVLIAAAPAKGVVNGRFEEGLNFWETLGDVQAVAQAARLGDDGATRSTLFQGVNWTPASFTLSFDFRSGLSGEVPLGAFPDTFFASVYFVDDLGLFDPVNGGFDDVVDLLDMDLNGVSNLDGAVSPSPLGGDWLRYTGTFDNDYAYVVPTFELFGLNDTASDSLMYVDNVTIIPEPATRVLAGAGLLLAWFLRRRLPARGAAAPA